MHRDLSGSVYFFVVQLYSFLKDFQISNVQKTRLFMDVVEINELCEASFDSEKKSIFTELQTF